MKGGIFSRAQFSNLGDYNSTDPFIKRFHAINKDIRTRTYGNFPPLRGNYEDWKSFIEDAVAEDAKASFELIEANQILAAWETALGIGKVSSFPISISASITDICNARCNFCAYLPERVSNQKLSFDQFQKANWLKFCRAFRPNGGGLGEPFAHPKILEILEQLRETAPYLSLGSVTNGSIMRPEVADIVAQYFSYLYVSVNAARKETYEWTMAPLKWERFVDNMDRLNDLKQRHGRERPWLRAGYVVHSGNLDELPELPALLRRFGFKDLNVNPMVPPPQYGRNQLLTEEASIFKIPHRADHVFRQLEQECAIHGIALSKALPSLKKLLGAAEGDRVCPQQNNPSIVATDREYHITPSSHKVPGMLSNTPKPLVITNRLSKKPIDKKVNTANAALRASKPKIRPVMVSMPQATGLNLAKVVVSNSDLEAMAETGDGVSYSYEWSVFENQNLIPICWAPWRALKIDIFERTQVCCNFFRKLPKFKWTNAKDFHSEKNMWNHPYMQHLRETMGTPEEVPFCTLCKSTDKRHLKNDKEKRSIMLKSQKKYYEIVAKVSGVELCGKLDSVKSPLPDWSIKSSLPDQRPISPYTKGIDYYRYSVFQHGFHNIGKVLMLARVPAVWAPFLAEVNESVHILSPRRGQCVIAEDVLKAFQFSNYKFTCLEQQLLVAAPSKLDLYDAVWLDGLIFEAFSRDEVLLWVRKMLKNGGRLRVIGAPGIGKVAESILSNPESSSGKLETLRAGIQFSGKGSYFTQDGVLGALKKYNLALDRLMPPSGSRIVLADGVKGTEKLSETELIKKLELFVSGGELSPQKYLAGMDRTVSFAALAV
ncbi:radical SAM protein [Microbulbifer sp. VTAC004]|uniref:radical SAM protein n=1 Tax=Microbulbifer sp. VTAC004 TaxID=3243386 RepID=UPI00403A0EC0